MYSDSYACPFWFALSLIEASDLFETYTILNHSCLLLRQQFLAEESSSNDLGNIQQF